MHRVIQSSIQRVLVGSLIVSVTGWCLIATAHAQLVIVNETFTGTSIAPGWQLGGTGYTPNLTAARTTNPDPVGEGWLQLTSASGNQSTYAYNADDFKAANATIAVKFNYAAYGGDGADGITFFLADASKTFSPGAYGGSLGYAQRDGYSGLNGGYIGLGIDEFGNYSNATEGRVGGIGFQPGNISIRGPGQGSTGYDYLGGTGSLSTPIAFTGTTRPTGDNARTFQVMITATNQLTVYMQAGETAPMEALYSIDLSGYARPEDLILGFTGSTGGQTNIHEIQGLLLTSQVARLWDNTSGDSTWASSANWDSNTGQIPAAGADVLLDNHYVSSAQSIDVGGTRSIRSIQIDAPFSYALNNGTIEFDDQGIFGPSGLFVSQGHGAANHSIGSALVANNAIEIGNTSSGLLTLSGSLATNGNAVTVTGPGNTTLSGVISGGGSLTKLGTGNATLSGNNTYAGGTMLRSGMLTVGHDNALGTGNLTIKGGTLASNAGNTIGNAIILQSDATLANITTSGTLTQTAANRTLTLANANQSGTVNLSNDNTGRTLTARVDSGESSISGLIQNGGSGAGSLVKTGAGTLILGGANTYTGLTSIDAGTLQLGASNRLADTSSLSIGSLGTLNLNGNSEKVGALTAAGGATLNFGSTSGANTFVFGNYTAPTSGVLVVNSWEQTLDTLATSSAGQTVNSIYFSGFGVAQVAGARTDNIYGTGANGAFLITPITAAYKEWDGSTDAVWGTSANWTTPNAPNAAEVALFNGLGVGRATPDLTADTTVAGIRFGSSASVSYNLSNTTARTLTVAGTVPYIQQQSANAQSISVGTLALGSSTVADITGAGNLSINSRISGNAALIRDGKGAGRLMLSGDNTFTGGLYVNNGIVQANSNTALGSGGATLSNGATLEIAGGRAIGNAMSLIGAGVGGNGALRSVSGTNTLSGTLTETGAASIVADTGTTLNLTGNLTGANHATTFGGAGNIAVAQITTGSGGVTLTGTGTVTYNGTTIANTYTGSTNINSGTLILGKTAGTTAIAGNLVIGDGAGLANSAVVQLNAANQIANASAVAIASDGLFNLNGQAETIGALSGSGVVNNSGSATTLTLGDTSSTTFSGLIRDTGGNLSIVKQGAGKLTLSGANDYAGTTSLNSGIIAIQHNTALGSGALTIASGGNLEVSGGLTGVTNAMTLNGPGTLANDGAIQSTAGNNTLSGAITLATASRIMADGGSTLTFSGATAITSGGTVRDITFGGAGNIQVNKVIGSNTAGANIGALTKDGSGTVTLGAANLYNGTTTINAGTLALSGAGTLASTGTITVNTGTLTLDNTGANQTNRIANTAPISLSDGRINFLGAAGANSSETFGTVTATAGANTVYLQAASGRMADLSITNLNHIGTSTVTFMTDPTAMLGAGTTSAGLLGSPRVFIGSVDGTALGGSLATPIGLAGWILVTDSQGESNFAEYTGAAGAGNGVRALSSYYTGGLGVNVNIATTSVLLTGSSPSSAYTLNRSTNNSTTTDANLKLTDIANVYLTGSRTLRLDKGGLLKSGATATTISGTGRLSTGSNGTLAVTVDDAAGQLTISSAIINNGTTSLIKGGAGLLTLSGNNSFSGNVNINEGTLRIGAESGLGSTTATKTIGLNGGTLNVTGSFTANTAKTWRIGEDSTGTLDINSGATLTIANTGDLITGNTASQLIKQGAGTLTIGANNTGFTGSTLINAGTVELRTASGLGLNRQITMAGGTLNLRNNAGTAFTNHLAVTGNSTISVDGISGGTNLTHSLGTLTIGDNTLTVSGSARLFDLSLDAVTLSGNATFNTSTAGTDLTVGAIGGTGGLTKTGAANMYLDGAATYTGATTVSGGTLFTQGADRLAATTALTVGTGATLNTGGGNQTVSSLTGAGTVTMGAGALTVGDASSTTFSGTIGSGGLTKNGTGALTLSGAGANTIAGTVNLNDGTIIASKSTNVNALGTANLNIGNNVGAADTAVLQLGAAGQISDGSNLTIGTDGRLNLNNFSETIGSLAGSGSVTLGAGTLTTGNANSTTYTGAITGTGGLTKTGNGTFTLSGANGYTGATAVNQGVLNIRSDTALGTTAGGTTVASGAALEVQGGINVGNEALSLNNTGVGGTGALRNVSGNNSIAGAITLAGNTEIQSDSGTLTLSGGITGATRALTLDGAGNTIVSGAIATTSGTLTKTGTGTATVSANSYTGVTTVSAGTLVAAANNALGTNAAGTTVNSGATLGLQGGITYATTEALTISGTGDAGNNRNGAIDNIAGNNSFAGNITMAADSRIGAAAGTTLTLSGTISGTGRALTLAGAGNITATGNITSGTAGTLTKIGSGYAILSGTGSNYTGATTVSAGTLEIRNASGFGTTAAATTVASGATLAVSNNITTSELLTLNGGGVSGTGALRSLGGVNTFNGNITIASSASIGVDYTAGTPGLTEGMLLNGITGAAGTTLTKVGGGVLAITGATANPFAGTFAIADGTVVLAKTGGGNATGTGALNIGDGTGAANSATVLIYQGTPNQINTASAVTIASDGNLNLNDYSQTIGSLAGSGSVALGAGTLTAGGNAGSTTYSGTIAGTGGLTKAGSGTLTLSGANSYTGATTINAGALRLGSSNAISANSAVNLTASGATLNVNNHTAEVGSIAGAAGSSISLGSGSLTVGGSNANTTFAGAISGTGGSLTKTGSGTLTLTGNNSYSGPTNLNGGTLSISSDAQLGQAPSPSAADNINFNGGTLATTATMTLNPNRTIAVHGNDGTISVGNGTTLSFGGSITGPGELTLALNGSGTFRLTSDLDWSGGTLLLGGGTLLLAGVDLSVETFHITANTILDFGGGLASSLTAANLIVDDGVVVTVNNWVNGIDQFVASSTFVQKDGPSAVLNEMGAQPQNQIVFSGFSGNTTRWSSYDNAITPVPEPSTYGLIFLSSCAGLVAWRRWRRQHASRQRF